MVTVGVVLLVLPGPGVLTIAGGLAVLAPEFDWARKSLDWMKNSVAKPPSVAASPNGEDGDSSPNAPLREETPLAD